MVPVAVGGFQGSRYVCVVYVRMRVRICVSVCVRSVYDHNYVHACV